MRRVRARWLPLSWTPSVKSGVPLCASITRRRLCTDHAGTNQATASQRLHPQDGVVKLDVGGQRFITLRSTLAQSPMLAKHVAAAEANADLMLDGHVFVDRDPALFAYVLDHMRNSAAGEH